MAESQIFDLFIINFYIFPAKSSNFFIIPLWPNDSNEKTQSRLNKMQFSTQRNFLRENTYLFDTFLGKIVPKFTIYLLYNRYQYFWIRLELSRSWQ